MNAARLTPAPSTAPDDVPGRRFTSLTHWSPDGSTRICTFMTPHAGVQQPRAVRPATSSTGAAASTRLTTAKPTDVAIARATSGDTALASSTAKSTDHSENVGEPRLPEPAPSASLTMAFRVLGVARHRHDTARTPTASRLADHGSRRRFAHQSRAATRVGRRRAPLRQHHLVGPALDQRRGGAGHDDAGAAQLGCELGDDRHVAVGRREHDVDAPFLAETATRS